MDSLQATASYDIYIYIIHFLQATVSYDMYIYIQFTPFKQLSLTLSPHFAPFHSLLHWQCNLAIALTDLGSHCTCCWSHFSPFHSL